MKLMAEITLGKERLRDGDLRVGVEVGEQIIEDNAAALCESIQAWVAQTGLDPHFFLDQSPVTAGRGEYFFTHERWENDDGAPDYDGGKWRAKFNLSICIFHLVPNVTVSPSDILRAAVPA